MRGQRHAPAVPYPRERPGTHCTGGWVGLRAGLDRCGKSHLTGIRSPDRPGPRQSLYRLSYRAHFLHFISSDCNELFFSSKGHFYSSVLGTAVDRKGPKLHAPAIFSYWLYSKFNKNLGHPVWVWTDLQSLTPQCRLHVTLFVQKSNKETLSEFVPPLRFF